MSDIDYLYVYNNSRESAVHGNPSIKIFDCDRVVFKNNESSEDYSADITGVQALAGGGAVTGSCNFYNIGDLIFSGNRATQGVGGAIDSDGDPVYIQSCGSITFKDNYAKKGGGAIGLYGNGKGWFGNNDHYLHLSYNTKAVTFSNNKTGEDGGAISARYAKIEGNKDSVVFSENRAGEYGGAIYLTGYNGYDYSPWFALSLHNNGEVVFRDNYAGIEGGAIYASSGRGDIYIINNKRAIFENNVGGAICANTNVFIQGNEEVLFKGNGVAIDTDSGVCLSTTASTGSSIQINDAIKAQSNLLLNTLAPVYGVEGGTVNGTVLFFGESAYSEVKGNVTVGAGTVVFERGASLRTEGSFSHKGGTVTVGQHRDAGTVLDVASSYIFGADGGGTLTFDLDYNMTTTTPMVQVGQYVNLIGDSIRIDDSGLNGNPAVIPLLSVGTTIGYNGKTYSFSDGAWSYTSNKVTYTLPMDEILVNEQLRNGAKLEWVDKTLYYTISDTGTWEGHVKGLGEDRTWRGDVLDWHDINKDFTIAGLVGDARYNTKDAYHCWAASGANMIQYWQDKYAPLFQSDELSTARTNGKTQDDVYKSLREALPKYANVANWASVACSWWFNDSGSHIGAKSFTSANHSCSWKDLGVSDNNFVTYLLDSRVSSASKSGIVIQSRLKANTSLDEFCKLLDEVFQSDSAVGLSWVKTEKATGKTASHAITMWSARREGNQCIIEYTDSDREVGATSEMILEEDPNIGVHVVSYYDGKDQVKADGTHDMVVYAMHTIVSPAGMDELLESYNNTKTLHWTGTAEGSRWEASSEMIGDEHHLADVHDGWKKECRGGGKTIYAHAYFTPSNASGSSFVFADSVNGVTVTNKDVKLDVYLDVSNVLVSGKGYRFEGEGELRADAMTVSGNLTLADQVTIIDTPLSVSGIISIDNFDRLSPALEDCTITMDGGIIWCAGMDLGTSDSGPIKIGDKEYAPTSANLQMQGCSVNDSGVFGCTLDFGLLKNLTIRITDVYASTCKNVLDAQIYALLSEMNTMAGAQGDYAYLYQIKNADIVANTADVETCRPNISGSTLAITADGSGPAYLTVGSAGVMNAESAADITICETNGATVDAGETALMTVPAEEVYLPQETSITASELTVAEESCLTNEGRINGKVVVEAFGTLAGSGRFGSTTVYADGRLMVGSCPGAPVYESLTMQSGSELIFCLDGSTPASADAEGWDSGTHSVLTVTQPGGLTVESGTLVSVGCSLDFLNASPLGDVQTLSLVQQSDAGSAELLNALQRGTQFMLAEEDDTLSALMEVGAHVHDVQWSQGENNTLQLSFIVSSCPKDALVWTNGSGDGVWNESSQNWETLSGTASLFVADRNAAFYKGGTVTLNGKVTVGDVVVSTSENLRWEGSGGIAGSGTLVKEGRGELVIASDNSDFAGSVEIYGGRVVAASSSSLGSAAVVLNGGALEIAAEEVGNAIMNAGDSTLAVSSGGRLTAGSDTAFGTGDVELRGGVLELNRKALENKLLAQGGIISGGSGFRGAVELNGSVGLRGNLAAASMTIRQGSVLTLIDSTISVSGSLTLGGAAVLNLNGSSFADGAVLITFGSLSGSEELLTVEYGADSDKYGVEKSGNSLILSWPEETQPGGDETPEPVVPTLDHESCDALVQSSWGVFTASHAFVAAIQGQKEFSGAVGDSKAWVSALGGMHRIDGADGCSGSDIDLSGAAFGFETILTSTDYVGFALGKVGGDVQMKEAGSKMEQSGVYLSVYGVHELAEYASNQWLSLKWSGAYGVTDTEGNIGQEEISIKQDSIQLNGRLEWNAQLNQSCSLHAFVGAEYFSGSSSETEHEQSVRMGSIQNLRGELGIGARYTSGSTSLYGEVRYLNDMVRSNPYADINGVRGYGANPGRQGIGLTVGAQQELGGGWSVHASYSLEAMSEATMHAANIGAGLRF